MIDDQLATEMSLSWVGIEAALERLWRRLGHGGPLAVLAVHEEDEEVARELWKDMMPDDWAWKVDPKLPEGAWYIESGPYHVWGCRGGR